MSSRLATDAEVATWRDEGWVLLEGLVGTEEIDALTDDLRQIFPSAEEHQADPEGVYERWKGRPKEPEEAFVWPDEGPGFRPAQQRWGAAFPFPGSGALNRICVHPSIVDFAERALDNEDIRLYQAHASAKYAGVTNYEQPMHLDRNHSWLPAASESPWWNLEGFLYLTDVTEDDNPTRLVSVRDTEHIDNPYGVLMPRGNPEVYAAERRGYWDPGLLSGLPVGHVPPRRTVRLRHRRPHCGRGSPSRTPSPTGSATTPSRADRPGRSGPSSSRARRHASWRSSAGPPPAIRSGTSACSNGRRSAIPPSTSVRGEKRWARSLLRCVLPAAVLSPGA